MPKAENLLNLSNEMAPNPQNRIDLDLHELCSLHDEILDALRVQVPTQCILWHCTYMVYVYKTICINFYTYIKIYTHVHI